MTRAQKNALVITGALAGMCSIGPARADINTSFFFDFGVRGELFGSDLDSNFRLENSRLSATSGRFSGGGVRGEFGAITAQDNDLSLSRRGFQGLSASFGGGALNTTLFGGTVVGRSVRGRSSSPIFGARSSWALGKKWSVGASALATPQASDEEGGVIGALFLAYTPGATTRLSVETARSAGGAGLQFGATHREKSWTARALVRHVSDGFSTAANPDLQTRRSGYALDGSVRRGDFSLSLGTRRFKGGRQGRDDVDRATLSFRKRGAPSVSLYFRSGERLLRPFSLGFGDEEDENDDRELLATQTQNIGLQVAHRFGSTQTNLNFDRNASRLVGTPDSAQNSDRLSLSLARPMGKFNLNLLGSWIISSQAQSGARQVGNVAQLFVSRDWGNATRARLGVGREEVRSGSRSSTRIVGDVQLQIPLARDTAINLSYRSLLSGSGLGQVDDRFRIGFRRLFDFGPKRATNARTKEQRRQLGRITGRVFDDLNLNGRFDAGEPPLAGVTVSLRGNLDAQSGADGAFAFADLSPRAYTVRLETKTLPLELSVLGASEVPLTLGAKQSATVDFPAVRAGTIKGAVWQDLNRNGVRDEGEKPLADALVRVVGSPVISFSNERGEWTLANLPPRKWKIEVDFAYLNGDYAMTTPAPVEVNVLPGGEVRDVLLGVAPTEREVVPSFSKEAL